VQEAVDVDVHVVAFVALRCTDDALVSDVSDVGRCVVLSPCSVLPILDPLPPNLRMDLYI